MILKKIEEGKQVGVSKQIEKNDEIYWYSYAIQKVKTTYIVYECEIAEDNMAIEEYEYENITKYSTLNEVKENYVEKYNIKFADIKPLKGHYIFNAEFY